MANPTSVEYENGVSSARNSFIEGQTVRAISEADIHPDLLELFLIYWCALGIPRTEPVPRWIKTAGENCTKIGMGELGNWLCNYSKEEDGHHLMFVHDLEVLVKSWNERHSKKLQMTDCFHRHPTPGLDQYVRLHEDVISGIYPFCQLAIGYEMERLSIEVGPRFIEHCLQKLGSNILAGLTFLRDHVEIDEAHTKDNKERLFSLLKSHPEYLKVTMAAGIRAILAYEAFLGDCLFFANESFKS